MSLDGIRQFPASDFQFPASSFEVTHVTTLGRPLHRPDDPLMARFNASLPFDWRLWDADITGSIAWARAIARAGLLTADERDQIIAGLEALRDEIAPDPAAAFAAASDEDIHSYVERRLTERSARPQASCTPAAAATTRSPPMCGCG